MQSRSHSSGDYSAFHLTLVAFVCALIGLFSGTSPVQPPSTDWSTRQILSDRAAQIEAPSHAGAPVVRLDIRFTEDVLEEAVELAEITDDDETDHCLLNFGAAAFGTQAGLYESSADRALALTPFRLRAFSNRGSPSA